MPKYKIVESDEENEESIRDEIELRFTRRKSGPTVGGRNPGGKWKTILWFSEWANRSGQLGLSDEAKDIKGLETKDGMIVTY